MWARNLGGGFPLAVVGPQGPVGPAGPPTAGFYDVSSATYGALGDGVTDDRAAIVAADAAAAAAGGGTVWFPAGTYAVSADVSVSNGVSWAGASGGSTIIARSGGTFTRGVVVCGGYVAGGGTPSNSGAGNRHGVLVDLTVDGNAIAAVALYCGESVQREYRSLYVTGATAQGLLLDGAQNNVFTNVQAEKNGSSGTWDANIALDRGAGNNLFLRCEVSADTAGTNGKYNVTFRQSATSFTGAFTVPTSNRFIGCTIERARSTWAATIYHGNGRNNLFADCDLSLTGAASSLSLVQMRREDTAVPSTNLRLRSCNFSGTASQTYAIDLQSSALAGATLSLEGYNFFENHLTAFYVDDHSTLEVGGHFNDVTPSGVTNLFQNAGGGTKNWWEVLRFRERAQLSLRAETASASDYAMALFVAGETKNRLQLTTNGYFQFGDGVNTPVSLGYSGGRLLSVAAIGVQNTTAALYAGTGSPEGAVTAAVGSIYLRTDGGAGTVLYTKNSGAGNTGWAAMVSA